MTCSQRQKCCSWRRVMMSGSSICKPHQSADPDIKNLGPPRRGVLNDNATTSSLCVTLLFSATSCLTSCATRTCTGVTWWSSIVMQTGSIWIRCRSIYLWRLVLYSPMGLGPEIQEWSSLYSQLELLTSTGERGGAVVLDQWEWTTWSRGPGVGSLSL